MLIPPGNIARKLSCRGTMKQVYDIWQTGHENLIKNDQVHHPLFTLNYCHFTIWWTVIKIQSFSKQKLLPPLPLIFCLFTVYFSLHLIYNWNWMRLHSQNVCITPRFIIIIIIIIIFIITTRLPLSQFNESPYWWRNRYLLTVERIYANSASCGPQGEHAYLLL